MESTIHIDALTSGRGGEMKVPQFGSLYIPLKFLHFKEENLK